jgi:hypothetical protein
MGGSGAALALFLSAPLGHAAAGRLGGAPPGRRAVGVGEPGARAAARVVPVGVAQQVGAVQLVPQARQQRAGGGGALAGLPLRPLRHGTGQHRCLQAHSCCKGCKLPKSRVVSERRLSHLLTTSTAVGRDQRGNKASTVRSQHQTAYADRLGLCI